MASKHVVIRDPEDVFEKVEELRKLIENENLDYPTDDMRMLRSLRCSFFKVEDALKQTKSLVDMKKKFPEMFSGFDSEEFKLLLENRTGAMCPEKSEDSTGILFFKLGDWNPDAVDYPGYAKMFFYGVFLLANDPDVQRNGVNTILDVSGMTLKHIRAIDFRFAKLVTIFCELCAPCHFKKLFIVNENWVYSFLFGVCKFLGGSTFTDRFQTFGREYQKLEDIVGKQCLPKEYGGDWDVECLSQEKVVV